MKTISYWAITSILVLAILSGGIAELLRNPATMEGMVRLGYPAYFVSILGFWKVLGAIALLVPGFLWLKEWAYAGIFFNMTGAAASHMICHDYGAHGFHVIVTLGFAALAIASWVLRPQNRKLVSGLA